MTMRSASSAARRRRSRGAEHLSHALDVVVVHLTAEVLDEQSASSVGWRGWRLGIHAVLTTKRNRRFPVGQASAARRWRLASAMLCTPLARRILMASTRIGGAPVTTAHYARFSASLVAGFVASLVGGVAMAVVMVVAYMAFQHTSFLYALRPVGTFLYGDTMLTAPTPAMYVAATAFHFGTWPCGASSSASRRTPARRSLRRRRARARHRHRPRQPDRRRQLDRARPAEPPVGHRSADPATCRRSTAGSATSRSA